MCKNVGGKNSGNRGNVRERKLSSFGILSAIAIAQKSFRPSYFSRSIFRRYGSPKYLGMRIKVQEGGNCKVGENVSWSCWKFGKCGSATRRFWLLSVGPVMVPLGLRAFLPSFRCYSIYLSIDNKKGRRENAGCKKEGEASVKAWIIEATASFPCWGIEERKRKHNLFLTAKCTRWWKITRFHIKDTLIFLRLKSNNSTLIFNCGKFLQSYIGDFDKS